MKHQLLKVFFCETITSRVASKAKEAPSLHEVRLPTGHQPSISMSQGI